MQLYTTQVSVRKPNRSYTLQLTPSASTVGLLKKRSHFDAGTGGNGFNLRDRAHYIEFHSLILFENPWSGKASSRFKLASQAA